MEDFPPNSHTSRKKSDPLAGIPEAKSPEKEEVKKVIKGEVVRKKEPMLSRMRDQVFAEDLSGVTRYIAYDLMLPALKLLLLDVWSKGMERALLGTRQTARRSSAAGVARVQYNRSSANPLSYMPDQPPRAPVRRQRGAESILLETREDAEMTLQQIGDMLEKWESASLADLYQLLGLPTNHVDNKWGWTSISHATIRQTKDGFLLEMPDLEEI